MPLTYSGNKQMQAAKTSKDVRVRLITIETPTAFAWDDSEPPVLVDVSPAPQVRYQFESINAEGSRVDARGKVKVYGTDMDPAAVAFTTAGGDNVTYGDLFAGIKGIAYSVAEELYPAGGSIS